MEGKIREQLQMTMGFQPIQTAPRDGTQIICASIGNSDRYDFKQEKMVEDPTLRVRWACTGSWSDEWGRFWDGLEPSGFANLTHWMTLPSVDQLNMADVCQCKGDTGQPLMQCDECPR